MADITKYAPINGGSLFSDIKIHFSIFRTKRTVAIAYCVVFIFIAFTLFLAFSPSSNYSSAWITDIYIVSNTKTSSSSSSLFSDKSYRSHFSSIFYYLYPNSSSSQAHSYSQTDNDGSQNNGFSLPNSNKEHSVMENQTKNEETTHKVEALKPKNATILPQKSPSELSKGSLDVNNHTQNQQLSDKVEVLKQNQTRIEEFHGKVEVLKQNPSQSEEFHNKVEVLKANQSAIAATNSPKTVNSSANSVKNVTANGEKGIAENGVVKKGVDDLIKSLLNCDFFDGNWERDDSYPLYKPNSCSLIDEQFNCFLNGRPDKGYLKLKWKPKSCTLPRLNGKRMLKLLSGKRLVFVGDSLNRNMWESLICILRNSVKNKKKVYEVSGRQQFRGEASYSFVFEEYKFTVEFFVTPFLVQEWEVADKKGTKKETLRLDLISKFADQYKDADIMVFNTGHWWTHEKTSLGKDYYQEGSHVYAELNVDEAFRKAITTWGRWIDANVNPMKSLVFFRGYSASHFSGGQWNSGGQCDNETEPITNDAYLTEYPSKMTVVEQVLKGMRTGVTYLNVTRMTDYRKDGHPSIYRKPNVSDEERRWQLSIQDCSHWCLPGYPTPGTKSCMLNFW